MVNSNMKQSYTVSSNIGLFISRKVIKSYSLITGHDVPVKRTKDCLLHIKPCKSDNVVTATAYTDKGSLDSSKILA